MAEIEKGLPNEVLEESEKIENPEGQLEEEVAVETAENPEVVENDDGSVDVNLTGEDLPTGEGGSDNLANLIPEEDLGTLGADLFSKYQDYKMSRKDWEQSYMTGLDLLGFKYENRTEPFQGASGATHPVLAEAVTQFQAMAYKELLPPNGPVRVQSIGIPTREKDQQATRVKDFMNFTIMNEMPEYDAEFDQMLFYLPLSGSTFKKVYYDGVLKRAVSKFVPSDDLIVPYSATSLEDAEAIVHIVKMSENEVRKLQVSGFYKDIDLGKPPLTEDKVTEKEKSIEGQKKTKEDDIFTLLEFHINLDLPGFEDVNAETGEATGIKLPYIVTMDEGGRNILSIRQNYAPNDPTRKRTQYFVHFKFLPGLGFYGFGLIHMIGGLSRTASVALRQLLDAGTLSNLPAGFKMRGIRVKDDATPIQPGEFRDVDAPGGNLRDSFHMLPYKEPSQTLLQLMGIVVQAGQRFASIADMQVGDGNQQAAVGTTVALLERGSRVMSAIHKRIYAALKNEFKLLSKIFATYLPPEYPYDVVGGNRMIKQADFDDRIDILPVADPNIFSQTQRISIAQTELQLAMSNPQMHNLYEAYRAMYVALGVKDVDKILPPPMPQQPKDPAVEHIDALAQKPFQAYRGQDHRAHIQSHLAFMATNFARNNPIIIAALEKNIFEHISLMAQEHVEIEFAQELMVMKQKTQMAASNPQMQQELNREVQAFNQRMEARKAKLIAEFMEEFLVEEKRLTSMLDGDPLIKLKAQELDLKAMENARKQVETEQRINLDKAKLMQTGMLSEEKLGEAKRSSNLRAETSLVKQQMANDAREDLAQMKQKDVKILKGPKS